MQPNIVWSLVASKKDFVGRTGSSIVEKYMQTRHPRISKSLPAMVETVVNKVSIDLCLVTGLAQPGDWFGSAW
jgi:hypothetical protein